MKKLRIIISATIFVFIAAAAISVSGIVLKSYDNYPKFKPFFNDKNTDYDVYFFGASNALNGIFPMQLWRDFGVTSYNFAWHKSTIALDYWLLRLTAKMHKPKIVFVDIFSIDSELLVDPNLYYAHGALDLFPLSTEKIRAINDIFKSRATKTEFFFPFYLYHNSWKKTPFPIIKSNLKKYALSDNNLLPTKGGELRAAITSSGRFNVDVSDFSKKQTTSIQYAQKIISYCRENGIIPVFMLVPYPTQDYMEEWKDFFCETLRSDGVSFLDMSRTVDFDTDKFDRFAHLNPLGAQKVTECIGNYITQELAKKIDLKKNPSVHEKWSRDYQVYKQFYNTKIISADTFSSTLSLLSNTDYRAEIFLSDEENLSELTRKIIGRLRENVTVFPSKELENQVKVSVFIKSNGGESKDSLLCEKKFIAKSIQIQ